MYELEIKSVGDSCALILDEEALKLMKVAVGDTIFLVDSPEGLRLVPKDSELGFTLSVANEAMAKFHGALKKLADHDTSSP